MATLIGILNITPDSFSDGNHYLKAEDALSRARQLIKDGADILDVGAESTRPNAAIMTHDQEWERLSGIIETLAELCSSHGIPLSIDTRHPETALKAANAGASWLNDVSGLQSKGMLEIAAKHFEKVILMHSLSVPADPKITIPENVDVVEVIASWAQERIQELEKSGINKEKVIFDPGIGFGKTAAQSLRIIKDFSAFKNLGVELLAGHSRKSFISSISGAPASERDLETAVISAYLAANGADYLRVHNIDATRRALKTASLLEN